MNHWSDKYVGLPYIKRENDCAALAARVQREQFRREVRLPDERTLHGLGFAEQIEHLKTDYACRVNTPAEGDAVLMVCKGRPSHLGIYCLIAGEEWILHAVRNAGQVIRTRQRALAMMGLTVEGFYRWI